MRKNGKKFNCQTCGKEFYRSLWQIKRNEQKFCSLICRRHTEEAKIKMGLAHIGQIAWNKGTKGVMKPNSGSFKKGGVAPNKGKIMLQISGKNSVHWKGGFTPLVMKIRNCFKMKQWRINIFERDNYTCQKCGKKGGKLQVDHYNKSFAEIFYGNNIKTFEESLNCSELWNGNNGRTLCLNCHKKTDTYLKKGNNYKLKIGMLGTNFI